LDVNGVIDKSSVVDIDRGIFSSISHYIQRCSDFVLNKFAIRTISHFISLPSLRTKSIIGATVPVIDVEGNVEAIYETGPNLECARADANHHQGGVSPEQVIFTTPLIPCSGHVQRQ